jgi:CRP-like cAMP-binding protein
MENRFFEFLTDDERADCLALGTISKQPSSTTLLQAGNRSHALFILLAGNAEVRRGDGAVLAQLASGDVFGEMSFIQTEINRILGQSDVREQLLSRGANLMPMSVDDFTRCSHGAEEIRGPNETSVLREKPGRRVLGIRPLALKRLVV